MEIFILLGNYVLVNQYIESQAFLPLPWLIPIIIVLGFGPIFFYRFPSSKTKKIVILGLPGVGKTILWKWLKGEKPSKNDSYITTTDPKKIESFVITGSDGRKVKIETTKDIGGGDIVVREEYENLIQDGTFIYFLINAVDINEKINCINSRLLYIDRLKKTKKLKDCGIEILITHLDETQYDKNEVYKIVKQKINLHVKLKDTVHYLAVNLFDENDIKLIKDEIIKAEINIGD